MRFNRYEEWNSCKLSEIANKISNRNINNTIKNVICNSAQNGLIPQLDFFDKEIANNDNTESYFIIEKGNFVYNPRKSISAPYGPVNIYNYEEKGIVSPLYLCFKVNNINHSFLNFYFKSNAWYRYVYLNGDSGARHDRVSIKDSIFFNQDVYYPSSKEQEKIGIMFTKIETRIEAQSKIIEDLKNQIKWIRYNTFSKSLNTSNHKLSDFLTEYTEKNIENKYQPVAVGKYGIRKREDIYSKELASDYSKNKVIRKDTLIIGMGSTQIDIGILLGNEIFCVSPAYSTYKIQNINSTYLNELLIYLNPILSKKYMIISARQGKSVNKEELLSHRLFIHSNESQNKIAVIFDLLYKHLNKEKDILELYKKQKAYLLKNMFI